MTSRIQLTTLALCVALSGCDGTSLLDPIEPEDVRITLTVSGGIAGVRYTFELDGPTGEVRGVDCQNGCSFARDQVLAHVSAAQVIDLAARLEMAGVLDSTARDYGTECCDIFEYDLEYRRGDLNGRVSGAATRLPEGVRRVLALIAGLQEGRVPVIIDPLGSPDDWPTDAFDLGSVDVGSSSMTVQVSYGGGCEAHPMDLVVYGDWIAGSPIEIEAFISHDSNDDPCDAYPTEDREFDLLPLVDAFRVSYGVITEPVTIVMRLEDPGATEPRRIEVTLQ